MRCSGGFEILAISLRFNRRHRVTTPAYFIRFIFTSLLHVWCIFTLETIFNHHCLVSLSYLFQVIHYNKEVCKIFSGELLFRFVLWEERCPHG